MKKLGQHFLINKNKIKKIVDALELKSSDTVIEIGPGHGEITKLLIDKLLNGQIAKLIAIEKDKNLIKGLIKKFQSTTNAQHSSIEFIEGNSLKILPELTKNLKLKTINYKLVGNIPYYITGYLLRIIGEQKHKPSLIILTIQKEVAKRICATPPKMNLLAASVQFWAEPKIIGYIPKKDFKPMPKVDSAIIKLTPKTQNLKSKNYYSLIKILFKQPRKTILNNLGASIKHQALDIKNKEKIVEKLQKLKINPSDRPQNLSIEQIRELS